MVKPATKKSTSAKSSTKPKSKKKMTQQNAVDLRHQKEIIGIIVTAIGLLLLISVFLSSEKNTGTIGVVGNFLTDCLRFLAGTGAVCLPVFVIFLGIIIFVDKNTTVLSSRYLGACLLFFSILSLLHLGLPLAAFKEYWAASLLGHGGGIIGGLLSFAVRTAFGSIGSVIIFVAMGVIGLMLVTDVSLFTVLKFLQKTFCSWIIAVKNALQSHGEAKKNEQAQLKVTKKSEEKNFTSFVAEQNQDQDDLRERMEKKPPFIITNHDDAVFPVFNEHQQDNPATAQQSPKSEPLIINEVFEHQVVDKLGIEEQQLKQKPEPPKPNKFAQDFLPSISFGDEPDSAAGVSDLSADIVTDSDRQKVASMGTGVNAAVTLNSSTEQLPDNLGGEYQLPPLSLMTTEIRVKNTRINKEITDGVAILEQTLENFGVNAKVIQVMAGPTVTRYELQPAPGVKVNKIVNLADDIALSMAASGVRIEAPIPGKSAVGIEVPRHEASTVFFREVLECEDFLQADSKLSISLGKDIGGSTLVTDLAKMPHLLIAGSTGSGKSVCLNTLICSILYKATPDEVKFLMIDPKKVEFANYIDLPHLISPVVTDSKRAAGVLKWAVDEMESRYTLFNSCSVKNFQQYNEENPHATIPQIVIFIDELADLMMVAREDVETSIARLTQMARAAGMHLVVATQRPSVNVITGVIKANIPSRIAFAVSSIIDSRTILDMGGAEKLLGKGDMLFLPVGISKPIRVQGAFLSEAEIQRLVAFCKNQARPHYVESVTTAAVVAESAIGKGGTSSNNDVDNDPLFYEAGAMLISAGQASTSFLQRRFRIGNPRAARLMDIFETKGVVSGPDGSKPRTILMTLEEFDAHFGGQG